MLAAHPLHLWNCQTATSSRLVLAIWYVSMVQPPDSRERPAAGRRCRAALLCHLSMRPGADIHALLLTMDVICFLFGSFATNVTYHIHLVKDLKQE